MKYVSKFFRILIRIFTIVIIVGALSSNLVDYTFSANITKSPNVLITINKDGSISHSGNLFNGQLFPSTVTDDEKGIGGINGIIRIENQFKKIDVDNLAIGIKDINIKNKYSKNVVYNSFLKNIFLKIEKGVFFSFDKTLIEYTSLEKILYKDDNNEYKGYTLEENDKFSINKGDIIDLKYSLHMDDEAGNELESITAYIPIYINLKESHIEEDDDKEVVVIANNKDPELNKKDHFQYIQGYPDNKVRPEGLISREEVAAVFYRLLDPNYRLSILTEQENFIDVESNRWSVRHIATLANGNVIEGYLDGSFKPNNPITRAELATIASKFDKLSDLQVNIFTDIDGHWANVYINSAAAKSWVNGYPDKTFKPDQYITRAEFVTLVNNVLGRKVLKENILEEAKVFPDLLENAWYYEDMVEAINSHIYTIDKNMSEIWIEIIFPTLDL